MKQTRWLIESIVRMKKENKNIGNWKYLNEWREDNIMNKGNE